MGISRHPSLIYLSTFFGGVTFGFGIWYTLWPRAAFSAFGFPYPSTTFDLELMDAVMVLYGVKDLFMGVSIWAATWLGNRRTAGVIMLAAGMCAGVDGWVVKGVAGTGQWNHWGYGPVMGAVGLCMMGVFG